MLAASAQADVRGDIVGAARVIDGDTLEVGGTTVRLHGIDAPELAQSCEAAGRSWPCGRWARQELSRLVGDGPVTCEALGQDRFGRTVARCAGAAGDLGATLVEAGAAAAYRRYALDYVDHEVRARQSGRGIWRRGGDGVQDPAAFRAAQTQGASVQTGPQGCVIKGNISDNGRIYHLPGQRDYARTRITPSRGERWFCSESEAQAAGWRPAAR